MTVNMTPPVNLYPRVTARGLFVISTVRKTPSRPPSTAMLPPVVLMSMAGTLRLALRRRASAPQAALGRSKHGCRAIRQPLTRASDTGGHKRIAWADVKEGGRTSAQLAFGADLRAFTYSFALSAPSGL
jgi:hypothetical protein